MKIFLSVKVGKETVDFEFKSWYDFKDFMAKWFEYAVVKTWKMLIEDAS